ncbi:hypothetical protein J5N97_023090 [Dioscorea zingiberensis]|uniref:Remorin n=1 Tax=Dioscorea zingiberensis TaxID=325984 RepID=A0A9D5CBM9_9LILI|nr:hypothetical protein J5N97_023090 [Dioscorea zingiberensis]
MGEEEKKNLASALAKDVAEEKAVNPPPAEEKHDDSKALTIVEKVADPSAEKLLDRDAILTRLETEKRMSLIRAWEDSVKTKAENKSIKKKCAITSWENSKKASIEAELKKIEEDLEKKKAEYAEKMKNKVAMVHKLAEEKRALAEAKRGEEVLKAEEIAAKYRASGLSPIKLFGCFGA